MITATYHDLLKCKVNPSVELPKFIKKRIGTKREFAILLIDGVMYIAVAPHEFETKGTQVKQKESGISLIKLFSAVSICGPKTPVYMLLKKGTVIKNITSEFISGYQEKGMCSYLDTKHEFKRLSPRVKQCMYCDKKFKKKIIVTKTVDWLPV